MAIINDHKNPDGRWCHWSFVSTSHEIGDDVHCPDDCPRSAVIEPTTVAPPAPAELRRPQAWHLTYCLTDDADPTAVPAGRPIHAYDYGQPSELHQLVIGDPQMGALVIGGSRAELLAMLRDALVKVEDLPDDGSVAAPEVVHVVQRETFDGLYLFRDEDQAEAYAAAHPGAQVGSPGVVDRATGERMLAELEVDEPSARYVDESINIS